MKGGAATESMRGTYLYYTFTGILRFYPIRGKRKKNKEYFADMNEKRKKERKNKKNVSTYALKTLSP